MFDQTGRPVTPSSYVEQLEMWLADDPLQNSSWLHNSPEPALCACVCERDIAGTVLSGMAENSCAVSDSLSLVIWIQTTQSLWGG